MSSQDGRAASRSEDQRRRDAIQAYLERQRDRAILRGVAFRARCKKDAETPDFRTPGDDFGR